MSSKPVESVARLGPVTQIAYVVRDIAPAIKLWTDLGVGPFFLTAHLPLEGKRYRGRPTDFDMSAAITYWGDVQVEIIVQHNEAQSVFQDWYDRGGVGVHHIGVTVDSLDEAMASLLQAGGTLVHEHEFPGAASAAYFEMPGHDTVFEVVAMSPALHAAFRKVKAIANAWDGADPIRHSLPD